MAELILQYHLCPGDRVELTGSIRGSGDADELLPVCPALTTFSRLQELSKEISDVLPSAMTVIGSENADDDFSGPRPYLEKLVTLGAELTKNMLSEAFVQRLQQDSSIRRIVFRHDPQLNGVPFHAAYLGSDFLCFQYAVGKQLLSSIQANQPLGRGQQQQVPYNVFSLINPDQSLPPNSGEAFSAFQQEWMQDSERAARFDFSDARVSRPTNAEKTLSKFQNADVVLLNCHHQYKEEIPENSGFVLSRQQDEPDQLLTARELTDRFASAMRPPRLIFSLSCDSGITTGWESKWPETPSVYGIVDALQRIGVSHYIGSMCQIPAVHAPKVVEPLFRHLADGCQVGEALRRARMQLRSNPDSALDGGTLIGLALVLYGEPSAAYFCAEGHRVDVGDTVECTAVDQDTGTECGRVVCQQDAGFGHRRCSAHREDETIRCSAGHQVNSIDDLQKCTADGCKNTFCSNCPGSAFGLCWFHCSYSGHPVTSPHARKTCAGNTHPGEQRTVSPVDQGWMRGLCDTCFAQLTAKPPNNQQPECTHCGAWITQNNPWSGACRICGERTCKECDPWHQQTLFCRKDKDATQKGLEWERVLEQQQAQDPDVVPLREGQMDADRDIDEKGDESVVQTLQACHAKAKVFKNELAANVAAYSKGSGKIPWLNENVRDLFMPHPRTMKLQNCIFSKDGAGLPFDQSESAGLWNWPVATKKGDSLWSPPNAWENLLEDINHLEVSKLRPAWGRPVLVAVATLLPLRFELQRGPVKVPASAEHLTYIWNAFEKWWKEKRKEPMPDVYLAAFSASGWIDGIKGTLLPRRAEFLFAPDGNTFAMRRPPLSGTPKHVREFAPYIYPQDPHERLEKIKEWVEDYLGTWDSVTWDMAQSKATAEHGFQATANEVEAVFDELADTGKYRKHTVNKKPALRPATVRERGRTLLRRKWVEIVSTGTGTVISFLIWQLRLFVLLRLPEHWAVALGTTVITILLCNGVGKTIKCLFTHKTN